MPKKYYAIVVPGLGDPVRMVCMLTYFWKFFGVTSIIHPAPWKGAERYKPKLERLVKKIDSIVQTNDRVSLIGLSAGGSMVLNAYAKRKKNVNKVVNISGRLKRENTYSFEKVGKKYPAFKECVLECEKNLQSLTADDLKKILTIRGYFDEIIPLSTIMLEGAKNKRIFAITHIITISIALFFYGKYITDFIKE